MWGMLDLGHTPPFSFVDLAWRVSFRLGFPLARLWWRVRRPPHEGALVAVYVGPALLLLRSSYQVKWCLPGGGVQRGETPEAAARRELVEEIGFAPAELRLACVLRGNWDGRDDTVHVFELRLDALPALRLDNREIVAARLVSPEVLRGTALTGPVAAYVARAIVPESAGCAR
jgi:8-oxo-dGTP pyrophosphatase MutT (NUDIX family)